MCGAPCVVSPQMYMPTLPAWRGVKSRSSRVAVSNSRRLTRRSLSARPSPPDHDRAARSLRSVPWRQPRLTSYDRLDGTEVRAALTYLGERIDTYLPRHPGLRTAVDECGTLVDGLLDRRRHAPAQRAALVWTSRALIVIVLRGGARRDRVRGPRRGRQGELLRVVRVAARSSRASSTTSSSRASRSGSCSRSPTGSCATTSSGACTGSARWPTSSTCTR